MDSQEVNWSQFFDMNHLYKLAYNLEIVVALIKESTEQSNDWVQKFKSLGALKQLCTMLLNIDQLASAAKQAFHYLLKVLNMLVLERNSTTFFLRVNT